ncbi:UNVERIFIED_CONTAM: hypothetical protein FKN15_058578 [Acipenser sinensis]
MSLAVGVVRILTQHLQSSRLNEGKKQSQSRDEELALLRKCSEVLIRNLLPPSLWRLNYMQHLVTEVVSWKKQSQSRDEELALLRKCSEVLIRNLLPPSLWRLNYMQHLVTEVVSLKVLEPMISMLSDTDHLNQWVVGLFNGDQVPLLAVETVVAEAELNPPQEDERADETQ